MSPRSLLCRNVAAVLVNGLLMFASSDGWCVAHFVRSLPRQLRGDGEEEEGV